MSSTEENSTLKASYYRLMLYAAIFGAFASLVTAGYITLGKQNPFVLELQDLSL